MMRSQLLWIAGASAIILALVILSAPHLNVTLNDAGTEVLAIDLTPLVKPKQAIAAERP